MRVFIFQLHQQQANAIKPTLKHVLPMSLQICLLQIMTLSKQEQMAGTVVQHLTKALRTMDRLIRLSMKPINEECLDLAQTIQTVVLIPLTLLCT